MTKKKKDAASKIDAAADHTDPQPNPNKQSYHQLVYYAANITHKYIPELGKKERKKNKAREAAAAADDDRLEDKAQL